MPGRLIPSPLRRRAIRPTTEEDNLIDFYNRGRQVDLDEQGNPIVPRPGIFQPDPFVVGPPELAQSAIHLLDKAPRVKERISSITAGLSPSESYDMLAQGFEPQDYPYTNTMGSYGKEAKDISINPRLFTRDAGHPYQDTLTHEFGHAAGYGHSSGPEDFDRAAEYGPIIAPYRRLNYPEYNPPPMPEEERLRRKMGFDEASLREMLRNR